MKKVVSVLLIAAALFGFYGGAVSINDVLACKDYWEKEGEKSTADMNKLEDGLNQLKDNEQAYLDGLVQVADGEKALADGEAQYAEGLKSYEEAPAKLAAGEEELDEGYSDYRNLIKLIKGLNKAKNMFISTSANHQTYWHEGFAYEGTEAEQRMDGGLKTTRDVITQLLNYKAALVNKIEESTPYSNLLSDINNAGSYAAFDKAVIKVAAAFGAMETALSKQASDARDTDTEALIDLATAAAGPSPFHEGVKLGEEEVALVKAHNEDVADLFTQMNTINAGLDTLGGIELEYRHSSNPADATTTFALTKALNGINNDELTLNGLLGIAQNVAPNLDDLASILDFGAAMLNDYGKKLNKWDKGYNDLLDGKNQLASTSEGIPYAFSQMLTNSTIKNALLAHDKSLISELKKYRGNKLNNDSFDKFDSDMMTISKDIIPRALKVLAYVKSDAQKKLANGEKQLADGYASYEAAPAQLADAEKQLADGRKALADGKAQLAQYEDGVQQVRDGLATLMNTEADLDLESILDRRNGDDNFDKADGSLDIADGLDAVEVGRGYQADDGVLITKEIMARAIGTAGCLAAGILAVLAALLSLLKKYKGAGVFAILSAVAGAVGVAEGMSAGDYFSSIAGSTVGATPFVAAGILAVVAAVFAVMNFTAKKDA